MKEILEIEIKEEVSIKQGDKTVILEKGDKIKVLDEYDTDRASPVDGLVRVQIFNKQSRRSAPPSSQYGWTFNPDDVIGWFATANNIAMGWLILKASDFDKREFGENVFRVYSEFTLTTSIVRFNLQTGTYAFIDNEAYERGVVVFQRMTPYNRLFIEPTDVAYKEFNINKY